MLKLYTQPAEELDRLLIEAGEEDKRPPEPIGGIPKQYVPGWIRWPIRVLFLPLVLLDLFTQRVARILIRTPLKQIGKCKKRGNCCYYILLAESKGIFGKLYYLWNTEILGFYRRDQQIYQSEGKRVYVMGCRYLSKEGKCMHYALRPTVCRKWPMIEYFGRPRILKGCGFTAVPRD